MANILNTLTKGEKDASDVEAKKRRETANIPEEMANILDTLTKGEKDASDVEAVEAGDVEAKLRVPADGIDDVRNAVYAS